MPHIPPWLTARPIAHRGLHDPVGGRIENTLQAFEAAIARGFSIELDVQITADGEVVVFHDHTLNRLTPEKGPVRARSLSELQKIPVTGSGGTIPSLAQTLAVIAGRTPVFLEIKSRFDNETTLAEAVADALGAYGGPIAVMSFDPAMTRRYRACGGKGPIGIVSAGVRYSHWGLPLLQKMRLGWLLHLEALRADFISYHAGSLPAFAPFIARRLGRKALTAWTVRDSATAARVNRSANAITFEGFDPHAGA